MKETKNSDESRHTRRITCVFEGKRKTARVAVVVVVCVRTFRVAEMVFRLVNAVWIGMADLHGQLLTRDRGALDATEVIGVIPLTCGVELTLWTMQGRSNKQTGHT